MNEIKEKNKVLIIIAVTAITVLLCIGGYQLIKVFFASDEAEEVIDISVEESYSVKEVSNYDIELIKK